MLNRILHLIKQGVLNWGVDESRIILNGQLLTGLTLNNTSLNIVKGNTSTLTATVSPSNATNKNVTLTSSNTKVATVDSNGKVTEVGAGTANITCTASDGSGKNATCNVTVTNPTVKVTSIVPNKTSLSLGKGKTIQLVATVTPANSINKSIVWRTENEEIATVDANGKVTAVAPGTTNIVCMTKEGNLKTSTCKVIITK